MQELAFLSTRLSSLASAHRTLPDLITEQCILRGAGTSELFTRKELSDVHQEKGNGNKSEYDEDHIEKLFHYL